jgi:hypothetical protein
MVLLPLYCCRYCHDAVLWRMLAELLSWQAFQIYLTELQVGGWVGG